MKVRLILSLLPSGSAWFKPYKSILIARAEKNEMLAHVCGTWRMGGNPLTSVVDLEGRVHGYSNLYVADSSIFQTSGTANPALTIAACSLRIADLILKSKKPKKFHETST